MKGVALWDQGDMGPIVSRMTAYALQNYFAIPKATRVTRARRPEGFVLAGEGGKP